MYRVKFCKYCNEPFTPTYANQRFHTKCGRKWRRDYERKYHREYERQTRKQLKEDWIQEIEQ
ncbi:MAG: hypothetical protein NTX59_10305 [Elusimicrobia bacterium]|nr:hypothetical protein [Elusimicrobiota bacterium]